jgi:ribosome-associated protein
LRRTRTIAENIEENLKKMNIKPLHVEGKIHSVWILLDYIDVVAHIFYKEKRGFYNLEYLWQEAPRLKWEDAKDTFSKTS